MSKERREPATYKILIAFTAIYLVWGSTYLAIRYAVQTLPPFLMAGARLAVAGAILYTWARRRGATRPTPAHWRTTAIVGGLLLLGGNGGVVWAEQYVPSGVTALLIAGVPLWMVLVEWLRRGGASPAGRVWLGLLLGSVGIAILVGPETFMGGEHVDRVGAFVLVLASLSWAIGSVWSRHLALPPSPLLATAMEMLWGSGLMLLAGTVSGEWADLARRTVSIESLAAMGYLIVMGSLIGFTAYVYLLGVTTPARVATYAYVNPVVAVLLGWAIAGEPLSQRTLVAAAVIVAGVVFITTGRSRSPVATSHLIPRDKPTRTDRSAALPEEPCATAVERG